MEFRDLKKQYQVLKVQIDEKVQSVCASAHYISGPEVAELEKELAEYVGVKHCITCANGTDALTLALKAWGIGKGDAVFVPDFTFFSSGECPAAEGATCVIVAVGHNEFRSMSMMQMKELFKNNLPDEEKVLIDVKSLYRKDELDASGMKYWRL